MYVHARACACSRVHARARTSSCVGAASPSARTSTTCCLYVDNKFAHTTSTPYLAMAAAAFAWRMHAFVSSLKETRNAAGAHASSPTDTSTLDTFAPSPALAAPSAGSEFSQAPPLAPSLLALLALGSPSVTCLPLSSLRSPRSEAAPAPAPSPAPAPAPASTFAAADSRLPFLILPSIFGTGRSLSSSPASDDCILCCDSSTAGT
eukprot:1191561-Pleurochrysis_carterae.AAC.1